MFKRKHLSEETKRKISKSMKGKPSHWKGKHLSKKTVALMKKNHIYLRGNLSPLWKNGTQVKVIRGIPYRVIYFYNHPFNVRHYIYEHRFVMEKHLGRFLKPNEIVHHINQNTLDNRIENLMLFNNTASHIHFHKKLRHLR